MIERLVEAGLLKGEQATPRAPWEIWRADLDAEPIRSVIDRLLCLVQVRYRLMAWARTSLCSRAE